MNPLIEKFFERDLTEAEAQALEDSLGNSTADALHFGEKLRADYLSFGLPDPMPQGHSAPLGHSAAGHGNVGLAKAALGVLVLAGLGTGLWTYWSKPASVPAPVPQSAPAPAAPVVKAKAPVLAPPPVAVPERVTGGEEGNRLSVVVELQRTAPVKVSILGRQDRVVRTLYTGHLDPGKWSLYWDGLKDDGSKAPAGVYHIQVESGASRMTKTVSLE